MLLDLDQEKNIKSQTISFKDKFKRFWINVGLFFKKAWTIPEVRIVFWLVLIRSWLLILTHWPMDFDYYIEIAQRVFFGHESIYADIESNHMPLTDLLYILMYTICPWKDNIYAVRVFMKFPFLLSDIGIAITVMQIIEKHKLKQLESDNNLPSEEGFEEIKRAKLIAGRFVAFGLPLILQTGGGRYDSLMIFCFTMIIYCLQNEEWMGVSFFAAIGTSVKYIGVIVLPFVVIWLKRKDLVPFVIGLLLGFLPVYPFLFTEPMAFLAIFYLRASHIAFGFSIWHAIFIIWNGFDIKEVKNVADTYDSASEPWFVSKIYLPLFVVVYALLFTFYVVRWWKKARTESINQQSIVTISNLIFIPLFVFAITFKAINIQVLAWFIPYFALRKKLGMTIEFSVLTLLHGLALSAYTNPMFEQYLESALGQGTVFYYLIGVPLIWLTALPDVVLVTAVFLSIIWYQIRTIIELVFCSRELFALKPLSPPSAPISEQST